MTNVIHATDRSPTRHICLFEEETNTSGKSCLVIDYQNIGVEVIAKGDWDGIIKIKISNSENEPVDWDTQSHPTSEWTYIQLDSLEDSTILVPGTNGVVGVGSPFIRYYEANINHCRWVNVTQSNVTTGNITVYITLSKN